MVEELNLHAIEGGRAEIFLVNFQVPGKFQIGQPWPREGSSRLREVTAADGHDASCMPCASLVC